MSLENDILEHGSFIGIVWDSRVYTVFNAEISKSVILGDYGPSFFLLFLAELLWISMECAIHGGTQQFGSGPGVSGCTVPSLSVVSLLDSRAKAAWWEGGCSLAVTPSSKEQ